MLDNFKAFLAAPYKGATNMSVLDWTLWIGLLLVILTLWGLVFNHVKEGIE